MPSQAKKASETAPLIASPGPNENPRTKLDKTGLYDIAQVKRLLDDELMAVSVLESLRINVTE